MNERIKELAEQAGFRSNPNIYDRNQSFDIGKFAELILQDIDKIIDDLYHALPLEKAVILLTLDEDIKDHFYAIEEPEDSACPLCGEDGGTTCGMPGCQY